MKRVYISMIVVLLALTAVFFMSNMRRDAMTKAPDRVIPRGIEMVKEQMESWLFADILPDETEMSLLSVIADQNPSVWNKQIADIRKKARAANIKKLRIIEHGEISGREIKGTSDENGRAWNDAVTIARSSGLLPVFVIFGSEPRNADDDNDPKHPGYIAVVALVGDENTKPKMLTFFRPPLR